MQLTRRKFLELSALGLFSGALMPRLSFAFAPVEKRFVLVFLRGGMDGLFSVPAYGDPDYARSRTGLAVPPPGQQNGALRLDDTFGLHPALPGFHQLYQQQQLTVFHAVASPYRGRSHADAQQVLESGADRPRSRDSGWLNAALLALQAPKRTRAIALGPHIPLLLEGTASATSWTPAIHHRPSALAQRLQKLKPAAAKEGEGPKVVHVEQKTAQPKVAQPKEAQPKTPLAKEDAAETVKPAHADKREQKAADGGDDGGKLLQKNFLLYMRAAGKFLNDANGPRIATVDLGGFDSHAAQADPEGPLVQNLKLLDSGLIALRDQLGAESWKQTAVLIVTEFGRTVAMNDERGSDHGTGTAAFLAGGAVKGGRIIADWPGLAPAKRYEKTDLAPTLDLRRIEKAVLRDHMGVAESALHNDIFPESDATFAFEGLFS